MSNLSKKQKHRWYKMYNIQFWFLFTNNMKTLRFKRNLCRAQSINVVEGSSLVVAWEFGVLPSFSWVALCTRRTFPSSNCYLFRAFVTSVQFLFSVWLYSHAHCKRDLQLVTAFRILRKKTCSIDAVLALIYHTAPLKSFIGLLNRAE